MLELNKDFKTTPATLRASFIKKNIYLPNHRKNYTSINYLKKMMSGDIRYLKRDQIKWVEVPLYDEFEPKNVIEKLKLETENKEIWYALQLYMPELETKKEPKDR